MKTTIASAALLLMVAGAAAQAGAQNPPQQAPAAATKPAADVTGKWDVMVTTDQGQIPATLVLRKEADKLVGSIAGPQGEAAVEASVEEKNLSIWFSMDTGNGPLAITMYGTVDGNAIKGTVDIGGGGSATWSATRASAAAPAGKPEEQKQPDPKAAAVNVGGTWVLEVNTPAGTGTPTLVLKQDGEKLTGTYTSNQFGEAAVTGTLKGNAIDFAFDLNIEGNAVTVTYRGTVDKDTMSGALKFGEFADGTFTGKRK